MKTKHLTKDGDPYHNVKWIKTKLQSECCGHCLRLPRKGGCDLLRFILENDFLIARCPIEAVHLASENKPRFRPKIQRESGITGQVKTEKIGDR